MTVAAAARELGVPATVAQAWITGRRLATNDEVDNAGRPVRHPFVGDCPRADPSGVRNAGNVVMRRLTRRVGLQAGRCVRPAW